ncbi:MAG: Lysine--tRNA ligase [Chlamydiae bacterium]|nr:Lysine--tRNA ligase [Chlamydiota bacterium]
METASPDYHSHEEFQLRRKKLDEILTLDIDPYPAKFTPTDLAEELKETFAEKSLGHSEEAGNGETPETTVAGRLVLFRAMGKNAFGHIQDSSGRIQIMFNRDLTKVTGLSEEAEIRPLKFIEKKLDLGDIIGIKGNLFLTQKGELTIFAKEVTLLCKTLLPLPDKHSGLTDKGVRYRKRWLDLISNEESKKILLLRSFIVQISRKYFEDLGFLEVETPILQNVYGGAAARPFKTTLNALDHQEMFLRISLEIPLKKLLVGGIDKVFEISKVFRNEGIDKTHNPEFTELEAYAAYWDYNDMMEAMEKLFETIALTLFKTTTLSIERDGTTHEIDVKAPWKRLTMKESIQTYAHIDVDNTSDEELAKILTETGNLAPDEIKKATRGKRIAMLFEELVEHHLIQPHHIIDHPIETTPLCKLHRDPSQAKMGIVERFESFILGGEFCNAYTELNDPVLQRKLLEDQAAQKQAGDEEANPLDEEFIEAICQGMPPASGIGIGIDRMVMLFTKVESIRDVLYFPLMRSEHES